MVLTFICLYKVTLIVNYDIKKLNFVPHYELNSNVHNGSSIIHVFRSYVFQYPSKMNRFHQTLAKPFQPNIRPLHCWDC